IYILGPGNIGSFLAHSLRSVPAPPPVTLLFHRPKFVTQWKKANETISLRTDGIIEHCKGVEGRLIRSANGSPSTAHGNQESRASNESNLGADDPIYNLVVTVKASNTVAALNRVKHRLRPESTILFLQNGMGVLDDVNKTIFPDIEHRPNYIQGIVSHGIFASRAFSIVHAGPGTIALGILPRHPVARQQNPRINLDQKHSEQWAPSSRYLLRALTRVPKLAAAGFPPADLLQLQLEKLAVNAIINPLTVLFDCRNGDILHNFACTRVMRLLISEISLVIRSLPELQGIPNVNLRFAPDRLEKMVFSIARKTSSNYSSMLQDIRLGKGTEIDYINGYIVKRGEEIGVRCLMNYMLQQMIKGKQQIKMRETVGYVPLDSVRNPGLKDESN
ncbi:2-dehydropantoate 2-reductase, partial [Xylona heveae TC161]